MILENCPNVATFDASCKCERYLMQHSEIMLSLSGGADSDIMLDFVQRVLKENKFNYDCKIHYVWFDTGIEYQATKDHLKELEDKYNIKIERVRAKVPVPLGCKTYGLPFISKFISQMIERLQNKNFDFKNDGWKSFEELDKKYPNTKGALTWWTNSYLPKKGKSSVFNIKNTKFLKEFMIENPPTFKISDKCCNGAKKNTSHDWEEKHNCDLKMLGLRFAEGGQRSTSIHSCFDDSKDTHIYRPIWWFTDKDKEEYKNFFNVQFSRCYTEYNLHRTGCAACPFGSQFEQVLLELEKHEPMLFKAVTNIFGKSHEYTRAYRKFKKERAEQEKNGMVYGQISIFD